MRSGEIDVLVDGLAVPSTGVVPVEIVTALASGVVDGNVLDHDEHPVVGATVVLVPEPNLRARADRFRKSTTDQYGQFELRSVPPGDYKLFAWEDVDDAAWLDPEFLKKYEKQGEAVSVEAKGHAAAKLHTVKEPQ